MVDLAYILIDPMSPLVVEYSYFECFFMLSSLLDPFGLSLTRHKPSNWFTLVHPFHPSKHPFHPLKVGDFLLF